MININQTKPILDKVLIAMYTEDHLNLLSKKVRTSSGGIIEFDFDYYVDETTNTIKMSKEIGEVISVGPLCTFCKPGDLAILDYTVDMDEDCIVHETEEVKYVVLPEKNIVADKDSGMFNPQGQFCYIHRKGDTILSSNIYGVIRDNKILCNDNYLIFKFKDVNDNFELTPSGMWIIAREKECDLITLTIEFASENSQFKSGDVVKVYSHYLLTINVQCNAFMMAYDQDVYCLL